MSLFTSSAIVGSLTLLSRVFGFVRDMLIAYVLGAGAQTDAFFIAFKLPNFMRRLFAEGAFNSAFLPMFAGMLKTEGRKTSLHFASETYAYLIMILIIVTVVAILLMPWIMLVLAPGFADDPDKFDLTVALTRITFPYILFISLVCLLSGILNSLGKFAAVAATPIMLNLSLIVGILCIAPYTGAAYGLAYGVVLAGITQFVWLVWFCRKEGMMPTLRRPRMTPDIKKLLYLIGPAAIGAGVAQVNLLIDIILASHLGNAVSFLYYADRIYELPLGVIGIAVATALLPLLSKQISAGDNEAAHTSLHHSIILTMLFGLPSAFALMVIADPVIRVIFEHGAFSTADRLATFPALIAYAIGLPAFLLVKIFAACFYAAQDTKTPVKIAIIGVLTNLILNLILMQYYQHVGLAMATSIAGWLNALLLGIALLRRDRLSLPVPYKIMLAKLVIAAALMAMALDQAYRYGIIFFDGSLPIRIAALAALVILGCFVYFGVLILLRTIALAELKSWFRPAASTA